MNVTPEILERYHLGLCTPEEEQQIADWLQDGEDLGAVDHLPDTGEIKAAANANIRKFLSDQTGVDFAKGQSQSKRLKWSMPMLKIAAVLAVVFIAAIYWSKRASSKAEWEKIALKELVVPKGQRKELTLPDGTLVFLNAGSVLRYPEQFVDSCRKVSLTGEGYFKVKPDKAHPFIIESTHHTQIRVLGTAFNVKSYEQQAKVEVSVMEGKVRFSQGAKEKGGVILLGGQSGSYDQTTNEIKINEIDTTSMDRAWAWKDGVLAFKAETFADVALKIERWYNVDIQLKDSQLAKLRYTGSYYRPELNQLLTSIGFVLGFKYTINKENRTINIIR